MENKSGIETAREEVTNLGLMAFEAECLLCVHLDWIFMSEISIFFLVFQVVKWR